MALRILASVVILFAVLFLPFWLYFIMALGAMIYFSFYFEGVVLLLISDLLYGVIEAHYYNVFFISLITSVVFLFTIEFIKKKTNFRKT